MTLETSKQHEMAEVLIEKHLGNAKMLSVCTSFEGRGLVVTWGARAMVGLDDLEDNSTILWFYT